VICFPLLLQFACMNRLQCVQGNHGEDVKELYYYQDSTPTHSYMRAAYKYPQEKFPYDILIAENSKLGKNDPEFELLDTGLFVFH